MLCFAVLCCAVPCTKYHLNEKLGAIMSDAFSIARLCHTAAAMHVALHIDSYTKAWTAMTV